MQKRRRSVIRSRSRVPVPKVPEAQTSFFLDYIDASPEVRQLLSKPFMPQQPTGSFIGDLCLAIFKTHSPASYNVINLSMPLTDPRAPWYAQLFGIALQVGAVYGGFKDIASRSEAIAWNSDVNMPLGIRDIPCIPKSL